MGELNGVTYVRRFHKNYDERNTASGSDLAARRAGPKDAINATTSTSTDVAM
jgi:hypothetical protein